MSRFAKYAWGVLAGNLAVVLWGAYVRASGAGAGCGSHWPLCQGEILPRSPATATLIELTHRVTSGSALLLVLGLFIWSRRIAPRGAPVRLGAALSLAFMVSEALLGAGLVLFKLVAHDDSIARVFWLAAHLLNTFLLLGCLSFTAWWASGGAPVRLARQGATVWMLAAGLVGMLIVGMSGAITALGDTLFPAASLAEGFRQDASATAHMLVRLRVLHPAAAIALGIYLIGVAVTLAARHQDPRLSRFARALGSLIVLQWLVGMVNIALLAPIWLQLGHLLVADSIWITLVLLSAVALADERPVLSEPRRSAATPEKGLAAGVRG